MDLRAVAELVLMASVGLTMIIGAVGLTVRLFLAPVLKDIVARFASRPSTDESRLLARIDLLDERMAAIEGGLERIEAAQDFDRRLGKPGPQRSETA